MAEVPGLEMLLTKEKHDDDSPMDSQFEGEKVSFRPRQQPMDEATSEGLSNIDENESLLNQVVLSLFTPECWHLISDSLGIQRVSDLAGISPKVVAAIPGLEPLQRKRLKDLQEMVKVPGLERLLSAQT